MVAGLWFGWRLGRGTLRFTSAAGDFLPPAKSLRPPQVRGPCELGFGADNTQAC